MHQIDTNTATADHLFQNSDAGQGITGTELDADWCNAVQQELVNAVVKGGLSLSKANQSQLWTVLQSLGLRFAVNTSGTHTINDSWRGSLVLSCSASNLTISGYFKSTGAVLIVLPGWQENSSAITVAYGTSSVQLLRGQGLIAIVNDTGFIASKNFLLAGSDFESVILKLRIEEFRSKIRIDTGFVNLSGAMVDGVVDYVRAQQADKWSYVGQVKRFVNTSGEALDLNVMHSTDGAYHVERIPAYSFREFIWLGQTGANADVDYAILYASAR